MCLFQLNLMRRSVFIKVSCGCASSHEKTCTSSTKNEGRWVPWPVSVEIICKPDKRKRLLWDASHSLTYPPSFSPRDNLNQNADLLDWNGDLPYTNFRLFRRLRSRGYFMDVWSED